MAKDILIYAEYLRGKVHPVTFELLNKGRELADKLGVKLSTVILGDEIEEWAKELIYHGADIVYAFKHPILNDFDPVIQKHNIVKLAKEIASMEVDSIAIKDMAGILEPYVAYELITRIKSEVNIPINVHSHTTAGLAPITLSLIHI